MSLPFYLIMLARTSGTMLNRNRSTCPITKCRGTTFNISSLSMMLTRILIDTLDQIEKYFFFFAERSFFLKMNEYRILSNTISAYVVSFILFMNCRKLIAL